MTVLITNNGQSRLASALTTGATSLSVTTGDGAKYPGPSAGQWFPLTLVKSNGSLEIVRCTARTGDIFTIVRAQEGTAAQAFSAGDQVELRLTAGALAEFLQEGTSGAFGLDLLESATAAAARTLLGLGTASLLNSQTGFADVTAGRALIVGAFGMGLNNNTLDVPGADIDALRINGIWRIASTTTGTPLGANIGQLLHMGQGGNYAVQIAFQTQGTNLVIKGRILDNNTWRAWQDLYSEGNVTAFGKTLLAAADAAAARVVLGLGSSALATLTTSNNDRTATRVPKNGDKQIPAAWVNFNGTGTVAIRDSLNVSSVTDNAIGDYTVNLIDAMANTNYCYQATVLDSTSGFWGVRQQAAKSTSGLRLKVGGTTTEVDADQVNVTIFGVKA